MSFHAELGERIRALRVIRGLSREELADVMFVSPSTIFRWEHGSASVSAADALNLAEFFEVSLDYLIAGDND